MKYVTDRFDHIHKDTTAIVLVLGSSKLWSYKTDASRVFRCDRLARILILTWRTTAHFRDYFQGDSSHRHMQSQGAFIFGRNLEPEAGK